MHEMPEIEQALPNAAGGEQGSWGASRVHTVGGIEWGTEINTAWLFVVSEVKQMASKCSCCCCCCESAAAAAVVVGHVAGLFGPEDLAAFDFSSLSCSLWSVA